MKKAYFLRKLTGQVRSFAAFMLITLLAVGNVFADEVTYVFSEQGYSNAEVIVSGTMNDYISFTFSQGSNSTSNNVPKYYTTGGGELRFYAGNTMTLVPANGYQITGIIINAKTAKPLKFTVDGVDMESEVNATNNVYTVTGLQALDSVVFQNMATAQAKFTSITVSYQETGGTPVIVVAPPTFSIPSGTYYTAQEVSLTAAQGANIYYAVNGGDPVLYSTPFTVNSTSTITAYAEMGETQSAIATLNINFPIELNDIAAFMALNATDNNTVYRIANDVQFVYKSNNNYMYVQDATGGLLIYDVTNSVITKNYNEGDWFNGLVGTGALYNNYMEMKPTHDTREATGNTVVTPEEVTVQELLAHPENYMYKLVILKDGQLSAGTFTNSSTGKSKTFTQGDASITIYNQFQTLNSTSQEGDVVSVVGFVGNYFKNGVNTVQVYPRSNADILLSMISLPYSCDFEGTSSEAWTLANSDNTNKWYIGTAQGFDNNKLYISSSNGATNKYNVSEASVSHAYMKVNLPASDVRLSFNCRTVGDANDYLQVSVLEEAPADGVLPETYLARIYGVNDFDGVNVLIPASNAGVKYLVFTWNNDNNGGAQTPAAIDNVIMYTTCTAPTNIAATVAGRSATITWDALEGQTAWDLQYKDVNSDAWQTVTATATSVTLNNLSTEVVYDVRVRTNCGGNGVSAWTNAQFNVPCIDQTTAQQEITIGTGTSSSYHPMYAYYMDSWTQCIYPASNFETGGYINSISLNCASSTIHNFSDLKIYVGTTTMANHATNTSWVPMEDLTLAYQESNGSLGESTGWVTYNFIQPYYYNGEDNLVLVFSRAATSWTSVYYYNTSNSNAVLYRYADNNVSYAEHPGTASGTIASNLPNLKIDFTKFMCGDTKCAAPADLTVSDITTDGAVLNWEAGDATAWQVNYKADYLDEWTTFNVTENTYTLTGLDQNTNYMVRVLADCGTNGMSNEAAVNFTTVANCPVPQYLEAEAHTHTVNVSWLPIEGVNQYEVAVTGINNNTALIVNVQNASQTNLTGFVENGQYNIKVRAFCSEEDTSDWASIDFTMPTICAVPANFQVAEVGQTTAKLVWSPGEAIAWTVEYGPQGFAHGSGTQVNVDETTVTLTGLNPYTHYDAYVKADCGLGYESVWSSKVSFQTECGPITITAQTPWTEGFESYSGGGNLAFDNCWATPEMSQYNSPFIYRNYPPTAHTGKNTAELKGDNGEVSTLVFPAFTNPLADLQFRYFGMVTGNNPGTMQLGYVTDPTDASTFVEIQVIPAQEGSYNRANSLEYGPFFFTGITNPNARIALRFTSATSNCSWNLDDFMVRLLPNCLAPSNLAVGTVTNTAATLSWTENGDATAWNIEYGPAGYTQGEGTVVPATANPFTVTGLEASTTYDFYVQSNCGMGDLSEWTTAATTTTKCDPFLVTADNPWFEDFEGYQGSGEQPFICWETPVKPNGPFVYCGYAPACHSGQNSAEFKGSTNVLVLPAFVNNTADLQISFWATRTSTSNGNLEVGYLTDLEDMSTFVSVATTPGPSSRDGVGTFMGTYMFPISTPANARIALRYTNTSSGASWNLDDFTVSLAPACRPSSNLTISDVTTTSASVTWTPGGLETAWNVQYKASSADVWTTVNATSTTVALTNLASSTLYEVRVKPACADETTDWLTGSFTTECATFVPGLVDLVIGNGTNSSYNPPMCNYYNNSYAEMIYPASEFEAGGTINALSFEVGSSYSYNYSSLKIYLGTRSSSTYSGYSDWTPFEGLTLVYSRTGGTVGSTTGWETYTLDTPFEYNGTDNLVVVVSRRGSAWTSSLKYKYTSVDNSVLYKQQDAAMDYEFPEGQTGTKDASRPNIKINISGLVCNDEHCAAPTNVAVSDVTATGATLTWDAGDATAWRVGYKAADATDWTSVDVTNNTYTFTGLIAGTIYDVRVKTICSGDESVYEVKSFNTCSENCIYTFNLVDSYGDGWNGAAIEVSFSDGTSQSVTLSSGSSATVQVEIPTGETMTLSWTSGNYDSEASFTILDNCNVAVYSSGGTQSSNFYTAQCAGVSCPAPTALTATEVENGSSTITWEAGGDETSWMVTLTPAEGDATVIPVSTPTYTVTGMQPGDSYEVSVKADCGAGDESAEVTVTVLCPALVDIALVDVYTNPSNCDLSNAIARITVKNMLESPISSFEAYYKVNNGDAVHETVTLGTPLNEGEPYVYTFTTAPVFTEAVNTITAWVTIPSETATENNQMTSDVTYLTEVKTLPYVESFNSSSVAHEWTVLDDNGDNSTFTIANNIQYNGSDNAVADDWIVSPCVEYAPHTSYIFGFDYKANSPYYSEKFSAYVGPSVDPLEDYLLGTFSFNNTEYDHYQFVGFMTDDVETTHLAFHAESEIGTDGFTIDNVSIKKAVVFLFVSGENGTVDVNNAYRHGNFYCAGENEPVTLDIMPDFGYHVAAIYVNDVLVRGENTNNSAVDYFTFTPENGDVVYVTFTGNKYNVNATVNNYFYTEYNNNALGATYTPDHEQVVHGGSHTGIITLAEHYNLEYVTVNYADVTDNLEYLGNGQYKLTLNPVMEDKNIYVLTSLDSTTVTYTVEAGQGTINGEFVVDGDTQLPAVYTVKLRGYSNLLSTITPAPGYYVESIIVDGIEHSGIEVYAFEHLLGDHTVTVNFAPKHFTITTAGYGNGTVSEGAEFDYNPAYTYTFMATPAAGYRIGTLTRNNVALNVTNPAEGYTETLTNIMDNYNYEVMFVQNTYSINATCGAHGTISPNGVSNYFYHQDAEIVITADPGYYIASVTYDEVNYDLPQNNSLTTLTVPFLNMESDHTINATFAPFSFNVTVNAGTHGTITPGTSSFGYGETPTFTITPDAGYVIADVTVDGASVGAVASYTFLPLDGNHTLAATFAAQAYTITASAGNGGSITPAGNTTVAYNGNQNYTISATAGYHVNDVFVDGVSVGAVTSYSFTGVTADHTIYAEFAANEYTITVNAPAHATINPGTMTVQHGATPSFVITPDYGYNVTNITVNGTNVNLNNVPNVNGTYTYTFAAVTANQTLTATVALKTYTITASAGANGSITPNGSTTVNYGADRTYTITPAAGYVVDNVMVDGQNLGAIESYVFINVVANHTINATFKAAECEMPSFMYTSHIDETTAMLHWSHPATGITFDIQYKTPTGTLTSVSNVSGNSYQLTDLNPNTTYLWQVRANCSNTNHSDWSNMVSFTTDAELDITGVEDLVKNSIKVFGEHQNVHILNNEGLNIESVRIFDAYGKLIYSGSVNTAHEVIGLHVAAGTYIVNVATDQGVANYKVMLMK